MGFAWTYTFSASKAYSAVATEELRTNADWLKDNNKYCATHNITNEATPHYSSDKSVPNYVTDKAVPNYTSNLSTPHNSTYQATYYSSDYGLHYKTFNSSYNSSVKSVGKV